MTTNQQTFKRKKNTSWRSLEGEALILDLEDGAYYSLNEMGLKIWELCDGTLTVEKIKSLISAEYEVEKGKISKDIDTFLESLKKDNLLELNLE